MPWDEVGSYAAIPSNTASQTTNCISTSKLDLLNAFDINSIYTLEVALRQKAGPPGTLAIDHHFAGHFVSHIAYAPSQLFNLEFHSTRLLIFIVKIFFLINSTGTEY